MCGGNQGVNVGCCLMLQVVCSDGHGLVDLVCKGAGIFDAPHFECFRFLHFVIGFPHSGSSDLVFQEIAARYFWLQNDLVRCCRLNVPANGGHGGCSGHSHGAHDHSHGDDHHH